MIVEKYLHLYPFHHQKVHLVEQKKNQGKTDASTALFSVYLPYESLKKKTGRIITVIPNLTKFNF